MTLEQLEKFCGNDVDFQRKPFAVGKWRVATNGYILIAENGISQIKLPELESGRNKEKILQLLAVNAPLEKYSTDHCLGFLGDMEEITYEIPMQFHGHRIDRTKLWKIMSIAGDSYRFTITEGPCFTFQFGKVTAVLMGLRSPHALDPQYEPKLIQAKVSQ